MSQSTRTLTRFLEKARPSVFNGYCIVAAFSAYFCMYAFRKPFAAGLFEGTVDVPFLPPVEYKILLIVSQVFGYMLSKFVGIKVVSEMGRDRRAVAIVVLIAWAELALLGFALVPAPWGGVFLFLNGMPLGMIWGLVFAFLEGRKSTELLGAGLSASYIVASGAVKTVGRWTMTLGVPEVWMPFVTGLLFVLPLLLFVYLLRAIPPPTKEDEALRVTRVPMGGAARKKFFFTFTPGLVALVVLYMLLTAYRDFRDNFAREIWDAVGFEDQPEIFTLSELPIAFAVLVALAFVMKVRDNKRAILVIHLLMLGGTALIGLSTLGYQLGVVSPAVWMVAVGLGLYLGYVPFGCVLFDRLIACVGLVGTAGFMIYVTDAFGYLGSVALLMYKNFGHAELSWLSFFVGFSYATSVVCTVAFTYSAFYFQRHRLARSGTTS